MNIIFRMLYSEYYYIYIIFGIYSIAKELRAATESITNGVYSMSMDHWRIRLQGPWTKACRLADR